MIDHVHFIFDKDREKYVDLEAINVGIYNSIESLGPMLHMNSMVIHVQSQEQTMFDMLLNFFLRQIVKPRSMLDFSSTPIHTTMDNNLVSTS